MPDGRQPDAREGDLGAIHELVDEEEIADEQRGLHAPRGNPERLEEKDLDREEDRRGDRQLLEEVTPAAPFLLHPGRRAFGSACALGARLLCRHCHHAA
mgnify:CR=1 FL=1